jgi:hypothetical protein
MNRKLLVTLLQKSIQELEMITEGFMEMEHYPKAIIQLAQRKTDDIASYIEILSTVMPEPLDSSTEDEIQPIVQNEIVAITEKPAEETVIAEAPGKIIEDAPSVETTETDIINEDASPTETEEEETIEEEEEEEEELEEETEDEEEIEELPNEVAELEEITTTAEIASNDEEIVEEKFSSNETRTIVEETRKSIIGDKNLVTSVTRNELLSRTENTISSVLGNKKISDIKQGINIGDRFRFQRELFRGNGEDMNKTLTYLNQLATENEALSFLRSKYGWATDNDTAEDFYQIVKRRFL